MTLDIVDSQEVRTRVIEVHGKTVTVVCQGAKNNNNQKNWGNYLDGPKICQ